MERGLDAWRTVCNRYIPLARRPTEHNTHLRAYSPKARNGNRSRQSTCRNRTYNGITRVRVGEADPLQEKWVKAVILQNLPNQLVVNLSIQLKSEQAVEVMQSIMNIYLHDHKTGLPKGLAGPMLCSADHSLSGASICAIMGVCFGGAAAVFCITSGPGLFPCHGSF